VKLVEQTWFFLTGNNFGKEDFAQISAGENGLLKFRQEKFLGTKARKGTILKRCVRK
jgi:hypothetical protein